MKVRFHPHALQRLKERGVTMPEAKQTVLEGEKFPAKYGRVGFRHNFSFNEKWAGKFYRNKQVEAFVVLESDCWLKKQLKWKL